ncbi:MAG TPA: hypothetical protein VE710_09600 [Candidatus Bathyarchaeia archaeon]|nr:hypothetical protein [Candidatus Bathyarchaeia archaeon]
MDVEKILRDSARSVNVSSLRYPDHIDRLEGRIHSRIKKPEKRRIPLLYVAIPLCLLLACTWLLPQRERLGERSLEQASYLPPIKEPAVTSLTFQEKESPLKKITLEQVTVTPPYVKVAIDVDLEENYDILLEKPFLLDEMGRKYLFTHEDELVSNDKHIYTFISEKKFEKAPKTIVFHVSEVYLRKKEGPQKIQNFSLSLSERYPKNVTLDQFTFTVNSFTHSGNTLTLVVSGSPLPPGTQWIGPDFPNKGMHRENAGKDKLSLRYEVARQDEYVFKVYPVSPYYADEVLKDLKISFPVMD